MKLDKIIYDDGRVPSIFFPAGKLKKEGSCQFATEKCLESCPSGIAPNRLEKGIYEYFKETPASKIKQKLFDELLDKNSLLLQWFPWGDCPSILTEKIAWIIQELANSEIKQCGFTRNLSLWKKIKGCSNIGLTVENKKDIKKYCGRGLVAFPFYKESKTYIYKGFIDKRVGKKRVRLLCGCSSYFYEDRSIYKTIPQKAISTASCEICLKEEKGCFYQ